MFNDCHVDTPIRETGDRWSIVAIGPGPDGRRRKGFGRDGVEMPGAGDKCANYTGRVRIRTALFFFMYFSSVEMLEMEVGVRTAWGLASL